MGAKVQSSFFYSTIGLPILPEDLHHVARVGVSSGVGMEVNRESLLSTTEAKHGPSLADIMKVKMPEDITNLTVDENK